MPVTRRATVSDGSWAHPQRECNPTRRVQPGLSSPTSTVSSREWEQFNSGPRLHAVVCPYSAPMRPHYVLIDVVMHDDDIVPLTLPHHGSNVNPNVYLSNYTELDRNSRFGYDAEHPIFAHSNRKDSFLSEYAEVHRGLRFAQEFGDVIAKYEARLECLRDLGAQDDIELSELSKRDFFLFIDSALYMCVASLVLMDNGNIRALWKFGDDDRVGIHFRGNGMASYVIFKRISQSEISRDFGMTSLDGIRTEIRRFGFEEELKSWPEST